MSAMVSVPTGLQVRGGVPHSSRAGAASRRRPGAGRTNAGGLHLTARGRVVVVALALLLLGASFLLGTRAAAGESDGAAYVDHVVVSGETLWQLAESVRADGEPVQQVVTELMRLNGLSGPQVMAGETIRLPHP